MKITGGIAGGIPIDVLKGNRTRPTTDRIRESLFGSLTGHLQEAKVLDLFAGSGALGLEAASRGASRVDMVEKHAGTCKIIEKNIGKVSKSGVKAVMKVHCHDSVRYLKSSSLEPVDIILADPPYSYFEPAGSYENFLSAIQKSAVLKPDGLLVIESSSRVKVPEIREWTCIHTKSYGASTLRKWSLN